MPLSAAPQDALEALEHLSADRTTAEFGDEEVRLSKLPVDGFHRSLRIRLDNASYWTANLILPERSKHTSSGAITFAVSATDHDTSAALFSISLYETDEQTVVTFDNGALHADVTEIVAFHGNVEQARHRVQTSRFRLVVGGQRKIACAAKDGCADITFSDIFALTHRIL